MIRITELALPLDYTPEALRAAIVRRLKIRDDDLLEWTLFKRSYDARKKHTGILFICIVDVKVADEGRVLARFARDRQVGPAPDTSYHPVAKALATLTDLPWHLTIAGDRLPEVVAAVCPDLWTRCERCYGIGQVKVYTCRYCNGEGCRDCRGPEPCPRWPPSSSSPRTARRCPTPPYRS